MASAPSRRARTTSASRWCSSRPPSAATRSSPARVTAPCAAAAAAASTPPTGPLHRRRAERRPDVRSRAPAGPRPPERDREEGLNGCLRSRTSRCASAGSSHSTTRPSRSPRGKICGLIGPNGAGKTTLFNCITRLYTPHQGRSASRARTCSSTRAARHRRAGDRAHVPEPRPDPVDDGARERHARRPPPGQGELPHRRARRSRRCAARSATCAADADEILERLGLTRIADRRASGLPYGTLKRVELARALCVRPKLLLLDEPASGLNHGEVDELADLLVELRERRTT